MSSSASRPIVESAAGESVKAYGESGGASAAAGGESGGASAAKLFLVSAGVVTVGPTIAPCVGVVRMPRTAITGTKSVGPASSLTSGNSSPAWDNDVGDKRGGLPSLWEKGRSSGGGGFVAPPPSGGGGGS